MTNLEELNLDLDGISFEPITDIVFIMKGGMKIRIGTPLTIADFTNLWNTRKRKIKIATGKESYAFIDKKCVSFYHIIPVGH